MNTSGTDASICIIQKDRVPNQVTSIFHDRGFVGPASGEIGRGKYSWAIFHSNQDAAGRHRKFLPAEFIPDSLHIFLNIFVDSMSHTSTSERRPGNPIQDSGAKADVDDLQDEPDVYKGRAKSLSLGT